MAYITLFELKRHLNIETSYNEDDTYLQDVLAVSQLAIENYCNLGLSGYTDETIPVTVKQATLLLAAHFYLNRQLVSYAQGYEIPYTFKFLLNEYRNLIIN